MAWDNLEAILRERPADKTNNFLAHIFAHIPGHGDIFWTQYNTIDESMRSVLRERYKDSDQELIIPLLQLIEEYNFERGSIGQGVFAIIDNVISNSSMKLLKIIKDKSIELDARINALFIYCLMEQENAENQLEEICDQDRELAEWASNLLIYLKQEGFFYI